MNGYILLSRKIIESGIMNKPADYLKVWIYLLSKANYKDKNNLKRGQGFCNLNELIELLSYKVGFRKEQPTKKKVWGIIEWLRNPNEGNHEGNMKVPMIETTKVTHGFVYTVLNYGVYQDPKSYEGNSESNNEGTMKELRRECEGNNKYKKEKKVINNNIKDIVDFLNEKCGTSYRATTNKTISLINSRFNDGFTADDFKVVISNKAKDWLGTEQANYLRPETLFGNKFESYLNQPKHNNKQTASYKKISQPENSIIKQFLENQGE